MAVTEDDARALIADYLSDDHAYGKPYEIGRVEPHEPSEPYVAFFNWGDFPGGWRAARETPDPDQ